MTMDSDMMHWHFDYVRLAWDSGFFFGNKKQNEKVDYSMIGLVDIEKISRDRDYATVEKHIATIINFTLEEELSKILEPTFVKLFKLSQLSIEYLQFCKKYLDNTVILLKKELNDRQATCDNLRKDCDNTNQYVSNLKKKNKDLKSHLQLLEAQTFDSFDCPHCNKIFSTPAYLESHMNRRHNGPISETPQPTNMQIEADKLQLEIKELKERLNSSEKFTQVEYSSETTTVNKNDIHNKLELHRQHVELELDAIRTANFLKYEQLSEAMLKKIEESKNSLIQNPALVVVQNNDFAEEVEIISKNLRTTNEGSTQTESTIRCADSNVNTDAKAFEKSDIDVRHEIEGIKNITELHLQEFINVLEQKVSTNLSHLETKIEYLLTKCSTAKSTSVPKSKMALHKNNEPSPTRQPIMRISKDFHEPKPAPRRQQEIVQTKIVASNTLSVRPKPRSRVLSCTENTMHHVDARVMKESKSQIIFIKSPHAVISSSSSGSSNSESESDSTSSDDIGIETEVKPPSEVLKPTKKISNTSTLRNRSLTSLKRAVDDNVTQGLSAELEAVLNQKLQSLGVSPEWSGIPKQSYEQAMDIINLQNRASSKNYANYNKFRESILLSLKTKLKDIVPKKKIISRPRSSRPIQQKSSAQINTKYINRQQQRLASGPSDSILSTSKRPQVIESLAMQVPPAKTAIFTGKKRVFFDLDTEESSSSVSSIEKQPPLDVQASTLIPSLTVMGSTTSVASSILDGVNKEPEPFYHKNKEKEQNKSDERKNKTAIIEDTSDWDVSDLIA